MSRDGITGGFDPFNIDPIAHLERIKSPKMQEAVAAYRNNLVLRGVTVADRTKPAEVTGFIGDDGQPLTIEARRAIAAQRKPYNPFDAQVNPQDYDYTGDLQDRQVEPLGESAQKIIEQQPHFRVIQPRELELPPTDTQEGTPE